jgi:hypothetical protein
MHICMKITGKLPFVLSFSLYQNFGSPAVPVPPWPLPKVYLDF